MTDPFAGASPTSLAALGWPGTRAVAVCGVPPRVPLLAIVGSRAAHRARAEAVTTLVRAAADAGMGIVSGGALGIDAAAHRAALRLGVPQVAVLPCGPDRPYPPSHVPLFRDVVAAGGALVFGRPHGAVPNRGVFASRNAIVVAAARRVIVAQAGLRSGSIATGRLALAAGKPLAVLLGQPAAAALVARGATGLPLADAAELKPAVAAWLRGEVGSATPWPEAFAELQRALARSGPEGLGLDGMSPAELLTLLRAEAEGYVAPRCPGRYVALR